VSLHPALILALAVSTTSAPPPIPRGSEEFQLGMSRAQVDSAIAARKLAVISNGTEFIVSASEDPRVEYEQYSFFTAPHGLTFLWKVTIGYRLDVAAEDFDNVLGELQRKLGEPASDTGSSARRGTLAGAPPPPTARKVIWVDSRTAVQLGGRWGNEQTRKADRMMVTWTDRRLQRLVDARRKHGKSEEQSN
jgi:hypothetical protein